MNRFARRVAIGRAAGLIGAALVGAAFLFSACDLINNDEEGGQTEQEQQEAVETEASQRAQPTARPAAPREFDAPEIYSIVRQSLALIETDQGSVTGFVTRNGEILVGAAAVSDAEWIRATLASGDVVEELTASQLDRAADLAVLGPIAASLARQLPALELADGEALPIGSVVYSVGFSTAGAAAGASISGGLLSRRAEWAAAGLTLFSTDATITDEQAGLVLVDGRGSVIGVAPSSLAALGLFLSAADVAGRLPFPPAVREDVMDGMELTMPPISVVISAVPGERALALLTPPGAGPFLVANVSGDQPGTITIADSTGEVIISEMIVGDGSDRMVRAELTTGGPYAIWLLTTADRAARYSVEALFTSGDATDQDDRPWRSGETSAAGWIDPADDVDTYTLQARVGDVYEIRAESLTLDVYLFASGAGISEADDDGLGGLSGTDAALRLEAVADGPLSVGVGAIEGSGTGGYLISIERVAEGPSREASTPSEATATAPGFPGFPDPPAAAMRGTGDERGLLTHAVSPGSDAGPQQLAVSDGDGSFEVSLTILGASGASARVLVSDTESGAVVFESTVTTLCSSGSSCIAATSGNPRQSGAGDWIVSIEHGGSGAIEQWQVVVQAGAGG